MAFYSTLLPTALPGTPATRFTGLCCAIIISAGGRGGSQAVLGGGSRPPSVTIALAILVLPTAAHRAVAGRFHFLD